MIARKRTKIISIILTMIVVLVSRASADGHWTANGEDIYNTNSGKVGIGTTAPGAKLDVVGSVNLNGYRIETITDSTSWVGPAPELFTPLGRFSNNDPIRVIASDNGCGVTGGAEFYIVPSWDAGPEDIKVYSLGDTDEYPASEDDFIIYTERFDYGRFYLGIGNNSGCRDSSKSVIYTVMARDMETAVTDPVKANYTPMTTRKYLYSDDSGNLTKLGVVGSVNLNGYRIETITDSTSWAGPAPELFTPLGRFSNNDPIRVVASDNGCGVTGGAEFYIVPSWDAGPEDIKVYSLGDTDEYPASEDDFIIYTERFNNGRFYLGIGNNSGCRDSSKSVVYTVMARDIETSVTDPVKANYTAMSTRKYVYSDDSGNVGIGTTNPQSKLAVNGTITAKEIKVTETSWSDFVFDKDYDLAPLEAVETFICENKHLPDIPSAKEVEQQGIAVSKMLVKQMQKIEELTLYIIEQNRKIKKLEEQMATLSACTNLN